MDQHVDARGEVGAQRRGSEVLGLEAVRDADEAVGRVRLVAVLRQPDPLRPEGAVDVVEELRQRGHRDRAAPGAATVPRRLRVGAQRVRIVRIGVEARAGAGHALDPVHRRDAAGIAARRGDAAGDEGVRVHGVDRRVRGIEQPHRVDRRRGRAEPPRLVRLVPDRPPLHPRVPLRSRAREGRDRARLGRGPLRAAMPVRPGRGAVDRHQGRHPARLETLQDEIALRPVVGRIARRGRAGRLLRRDPVPAQVVADDLHADRVESVEPLGEGPGAVRDPRVVLDAVPDRRRRRADRGRGERADEAEHEEDHPQPQSARRLPVGLYDGVKDPSYDERLARVGWTRRGSPGILGKFGG